MSGYFGGLLAVLVLTQTLLTTSGQQTVKGVASVSTYGHTSISSQSSTAKYPNNSTHPTFNMNMFLPYCSHKAVQSCAFIPMNQCEDCSMVAAGFFGFVVILVGLGVLIGNGLVIWIFAKNESSFTGTYGQVKVSLAFSDISTSILFFVIIFPKFLQSLTSTSYEIYMSEGGRSHGHTANVAGFFHFFIYAASFYHLVLLAQQRLYAVACPLKYQQQKAIHVYVGLAIVWITSFIIAMVPVWYENATFFYDTAIFLYTGGSRDRTYIKIHFCFLSIVPYALMAILTVATGIRLRQNLRRGRRLSTGHKETNKNEVMIFFTLVLMVAGLTLTVGPYVIVVLLELEGYWKLRNFEYMFVSFYYLSLANSLVNVLVYSVVDSKFRKTAGDVLRSLFCGKHREERRRRKSSSQVKSERTSLSQTPSAARISNGLAAV